MLPVPGTVSPALQARIAAPYPPGWDVVPRTAQDWRDLAARSAAAVAPLLPSIRERLGVQVEATRMAGVPVFVVTPSDLPPENRDRLLLHLHGGGYVLYPGEAGAGEAMLMAGYGGFKIVSVDYRMPPDFPFPAALDDAMAVWRDLVGRNDPSQDGDLRQFGRWRTDPRDGAARPCRGVALPGRDRPGYALGRPDGRRRLAARPMPMSTTYSSRIRAGWAPPRPSMRPDTISTDPLVSPIHGDFRAFPPAILTSGTRDLFLSHTVRTHRRLRQAGVEAILQVFEGQSHAQFLDPFVPETEEALGEIARFFRRHLLA